MRFIGLDVHRDFCEVAISTGGKARSAGRIDTTPQALQLFAGSLAPSDRVVLESTGNALAIARILKPHVAEVVLANPMQVRAICHAKVKNDRFDARTLVELLAVDLIPRVWVSDERTRALSPSHLTPRAADPSAHQGQERSDGRARQKPQGPPAGQRPVRQARTPLARRAGAARRRTRHDRGLPAPDRLPHHRDHPGRPAPRQARPRQRGDQAADDDPRHRRHDRGDTDRRDRRHPPLPLSQKLVGYLGLDARVRQSGVAAARHGRISKEGTSAARHVLVQAAWAAIKTPGPLRAFYQRIRARRGAQIAIVAVARKLAMLCWQLLTTEQDYAYQRPTLVARKLRTLELRAGAPHACTTSTTPRASTAMLRAAQERQLADHAELAYRRLIADWKATGPNKGAGAAPGRASQGPSSDQAARQTPAPEPAL